MRIYKCDICTVKVDGPEHFEYINLTNQSLGKIELCQDCIEVVRKETESLKREIILILKEMI